MVKKYTKEEINKLSTEYLIKNISDFLDSEYKEYVFYVLANRALPSLRDGFKTGARKILHAAFKGTMKDGSLKKVPNLAGNTMDFSLYPHGDNSLNGTIVTLSQEFKFNLNPLYIDGQNGTLRSPKASASPRYLYVRLSKYSHLWKTDYELLNFLFDEGQFVEPESYLPIIPMVIANSQEGMAPGYRFSTMSYNPIDIIDCCMQVLNGGPVDNNHKENKVALFDEDNIENFILHPYIRGIKKENWKYEAGKWVNYGTYKVDLPHDCIIVTDLPYDQTYDGFEKMLNKYIDQEKIKDWKNRSEGNNIEYVIQFHKKRLGVFLKAKNAETKIQDMFKLKKIVPEDLLWVLDENNKIKHFKTPQSLIEYFTNWRLTIYKDRKDRLVKVLEKQYQDNLKLVKFIELVCKGKLKIRNRSLKDVETDMKANDLPKELINTSMSKVTIEERDKIIKDNEAIKERYEYIKNSTIKQLYLDDLKALRKELLPDFK